MKKVVIAIAALTMAVVANAATFKWTGANIYTSNGTTTLTGLASVYAYVSTGTLADSVKVTDVYVIAGTIKSDVVGTATGYTMDWTSAVVGSTYNFYLMIEDNSKTFDSSISSPSVIKQGMAQATSTTTIGFANMATATQTAGNWQSAAVPEPTSGLLLLLGMAGLALKRKIA